VYPQFSGGFALRA